MNIKYFSWVRDKVGLDEEEVELDEGTNCVKDLIYQLTKISDKHSEALSDLSLIKCAVNMEVVNLDHKVHSSDEIAFFPPMTGG